MKLFTGLILASALFISQPAFAECTTYECKKKATLADKTISEAVKKELKEFYEKSDKLYNETREKRKELRNALSEDAKKAMAKHHKRKRKPTKTAG